MRRMEIIFGREQLIKKGLHYMKWIASHIMKRVTSLTEMKVINGLVFT